MSLALGIMTVLGGLYGAGSTIWSKQKDQDELRRQKKQQQQQYELNKQYGDSLYSLQKNESLEQLDIQRQNLNTQLDMGIEDYNTSLLAQAFGIQDARIQNSSAVGASLAAEGAGGTRGNAGNDMIRAYATQGLERNIDLQEKQNASQLNQMITGANTAVSAINREKDSWSEGGYRHREKALQDDYNYKMFQFGQSEFDYQIDQSDPWKLSWDNFFDFSGAILSGATSGATMGGGFDQYTKGVDKKNPMPKELPQDTLNYFHNVKNLYGK